MAWLRKKSDPISERARDLNAEIASLEAEIKRLDSKLSRGNGQARQPGGTIPGSTNTYRAGHETSVETAPPPARHEPVFEEVRRTTLTTQVETADTPEHYNDLGVRKFDLPAWLRRLRGNFHGPTTSNPKLVSYLAAGGIQGLSPLRREKRVARNRFIVLVSFLFLVLLGILIVFVRTR